MTLKTHCTPRRSVFDRNRRDIVLDLSDFLEDKIDGDQFFEENFITGGMKTLFEKTFARLENRGDQASTFLLTQSMGGGKTHNMIALGLARQESRPARKGAGQGWPGSKLGGVRVIGFHGRQTDAQFGIWGELADQLGKKEVFKDYYQPLQAPGQSAWINLLKGEPTLIFLDELPPYLEATQAKQIGAHDAGHGHRHGHRQPAGRGQQGGAVQRLRGDRRPHCLLAGRRRRCSTPPWTT